jgi:hypothetical protein
MKMKTTKMYEVRKVESGNVFSTMTNGKLYNYQKARKLAARAKRLWKLDVITAPVMVAA